MGFPPNLINLLSHWNRTRTSTLWVNGEASEPIPTQCGIGQGDVFSCILYSIFIHSLHGYLKSKDLGITPYPGVKLTAAGFVDDVSALLNSLPAAQATARAVEEWGKAFGHEVQLARNKTAILYLPPPNKIRDFYKKVAQQPRADDIYIPTHETATLSCGKIIPFTDTYKYLGYLVNGELDEDHHMTKTLQYINSNYARYFAYNSVTRSLNPTGINQLLKSTCMPNYLASIINPTTHNLNALDTAIHSLMRTGLGPLPPSPPTLLLITESNIPTAKFLMTRGILTTLLNLSITVYREAPNVAIHRAQQEIRQRGGALPLNSWLRRALDYLNPYVHTLGDYMNIHAILQLPQGRPLTPSDATLAAYVYARKVDLHSIRGDLARHNSKYNTNVTHFSQPPSPNPAQCVIDLAFGFQRYGNLIGYPSKCVPLSLAAAPGGIALCTRVTAPITRDLRTTHYSAREGSLALHYPPLAPQTWIRTGPQTQDDYRKAANGIPCPLCNHATADVHHVLCTCPHFVLDGPRSAALASASEFIPTLVDHIYKASHKPSAELTATYRALCNLPRPDWSTASGKALFYRLALAAPWPEACVDDPAAHHARLLGKLMDLTIVKNNALHPIANSWVPWGSKIIAKLCRVWVDAVDDHSNPYQAQPPPPPPAGP
jgi:hypothetical protein